MIVSIKIVTVDSEAKELLADFVRWLDRSGRLNPDPYSDGESRVYNLVRKYSRDTIDSELDSND